MSGAQRNRAQNARMAAPSSGSKSPPIGSRFDGNRDPTLPGAGSSRAPGPEEKDPITRAMKNMDLGYAAIGLVRGHKVDLARRPPQPSKLGREIQMGLNTFSVEVPIAKVAQYQVLVGSGVEKRGLIKKVWHSKAIQSKLPSPQSWIFDGNALAWSMSDMGEMRVNVDLDAEQGFQPRAGGKTNIHRVIIRRTTDVDFASLVAYMAGKADFNNKCLEAVTFMDHLLREYPSKHLTSIKRSFFLKGQKRFELGGGIEAFKGCYQSLRIAHSPMGGRLTCNVDVANGTFFTGGDLKTVVVRLAELRGEAEIGLMIRPDAEDHLKHKFNELKRLKKCHVYTNHRGKGIKDDYIIDYFMKQIPGQYVMTIKENGQERQVTVTQYFMEKYKLKIYNPTWPLVQMTKRAVIPLELLRLEENQRYPFKLSDRQTAAMIKVAVTEPAKRWGDIEHGLKMVNWPADPFLTNYKMKIDTNKTIVKARLLQNPKLQFGTKGKLEDPRTSGRWDLKGKKFLTPNTAPLKSWGVCVVSGRYPANKADVERFMAAFVQTYKGHGGLVESAVPVMIQSSSGDPGKCVEELWNATGNKFLARPQILVFVLPDKDSTVYGRIKRSCECRYGVLSQCMQMAHVSKAQPQYMSNVCMKFNAKLGGVTNRAVGPTSSGPNGNFKVPTVVIGADVSHAAPGGLAASMAAITVSTDKLATRYAAGCETNGYRREMILPENFTKLLKPLLQNWVHNVGGGQFPKHLIYFRDGVSEGQFAQVIEQEVSEIKKIFASINPNHGIKFLVIIASKRHHVRFFPKASEGDRNGNPLPGTLVETSVTNPFENDFYLCSHSAIKGTARPIHYNVLVNEPGMSNDELYTLIYEHSYQYIRATTPVSLFPAVYYAHLASNRAVHHDKDFGNFAGGRQTEASKTKDGKSKSGKSGASSGDDDKNRPSPPLMSMPDQAVISKSMWYI